MICILKRSIPVCHMKYTNNMYYIYVLKLSVTLSLRPASNVMESFAVPFFIFWQTPVLFTSQTSYGRLWHTEKYMWHSPSFNCTIHWSCRTLAYQYGCLFIIITQDNLYVHYYVYILCICKRNNGHTAEIRMRIHSRMIYTSTSHCKISTNNSIINVGWAWWLVTMVIQFTLSYGWQTSNKDHVKIGVTSMDCSQRI